MNRRDFLQDVLIAAPALAWAQGLPPAGKGVLESQTEIAKAPLRPEDDARLKHIPTEATLKGARYSVSAPDTLDVADRLQLSIISLTNRWFPQHRWALGFHVFPGKPYAMVVPGSTDAWQNQSPKYVETLALCRLASGSNLNLDVDRKILATYIGLMGEDGLNYDPEKELPEIKGDRHCSEVWAEGRWLMALATLAQVDADSRWEAIGRKKVDRLLALTRKQDDFRFFWKRTFKPGDEPPPNATEPPPPQCEKPLYNAGCDPAFHPAYSLGAVGHGAGRFYQLTKYAPALELCRGMGRWALARIFTHPDGRYVVEHFYHGTYALLSLAEYAVVTEDADAFRRVDASYRWAREMGDPLVGWYTDYMPGTESFEKCVPQAMETCGVANLVTVALYLSRNGLGDYWDDLDRWVRNRLAASQVASLESLERVPAEYLSPVSPHLDYPAVDTRDMAPRVVGSCFSAMMPNDGFPVRRGKDGRDKVSTSLAGCCATNPIRAMYFVWDSIVTGREDDIRVNLLLNRASEWVDVASYLPVDGKVVLRIKKTRKVMVRMPEWVELNEVAVSIRDRRVDAPAEGRYLRVENLQPGDQVVFTFPVPERTLNRVIARWPYRLTMRGSQVVAIDPPGRGYPLYREQPQGKLLEKERFVATKRVVW